MQINDARFPKRFWRWVYPIETGCWIWSGAISTVGYGRVWWREAIRQAHRAVYEEIHGPQPATVLICHTCDVRTCVNPAHLWAGSPLDNMQDCSTKKRNPRWPGAWTAFTCSRGHPRDEQHVYIYPRVGRAPLRGCRKCRQMAVERYTARKLAASA